MPAGSGPAQTLSASQYAFAVGGDASIRTSETQKTSGLVLGAADQILRERCMRSRGFRYVQDPAPTTDPLPSVTGYPSTFYPNPLPSAYPEATLLAFRERQGFGLPPNSHVDTDPDDRYLKTLSPTRRKAWLKAWMGQNGCYGAAEVQLFGSRRAANLEQQVPALIYNYLNTVVYTPKGAIDTSHATTANAAAAWSRCMRASTGRAWPDENAVVSAVSGPAADRTHASARRLTVADTKCAYSTGQAQAFAAAFRQAATHLPTRIQTPLRYLLAHRAGWIKKAQRIVVERLDSALTSSRPRLR